MDVLRVRVLQPEEYGRWEEFVDNHPRGTVFHHYYWHRFVFSSDPGLTLSVVCCFRGQEIVGGTVAGGRTRMKILNFLVAPFATPFYGILTVERESKYLAKQEIMRFEVLRKLLEFLQKEFHYITFSFPPGFEDIRVFNWEKYTDRVLFTYRQNIENPVLLYENFLPSLKRQIKKGEKLNYTIKDNLDKEHLGRVFSLIKKGYERKEYPLKLSEKQIESIIDSPEIKKHTRVFSIWMENTPVAGLIIIHDRHCSYYWLAGGDPDYFSTGLNQLLLWEVIKILAGRGIKCFDFVGANTEPSANYKAAFNFDLVPYYHVEKATKAMLRFLLFFY